MQAKEIVLDLFRKWETGDSSAFFNALADDMQWTAIGTTPISGVLHSKAEYLAHTYQPLQKVFGGPTSCKVKRVIADGDIVVVEWQGETPLLKGGSYVNDYCWIVRVEEGKLAEVTGYFDTAAVDKLFA
ncbi:MAG: nuclear transport factor 2 family protein [Edaphobacter sp.]